jgi:hypothetical protein
LEIEEDDMMTELAPLSYSKQWYGLIADDDAFMLCCIVDVDGKLRRLLGSPIGKRHDHTTTQYHHTVRRSTEDGRTLSEQR